MAGSLKPDGVGPEAAITFLDYNMVIDWYGTPDKLLDQKGPVNRYEVIFCGATLPNEQQHITFKVDGPCTIWAMGQHYSDSAGQTPKPVKLYKRNSGNAYDFVGSHATQDTVWYKLFPELEAGTYKITSVYDYANFAEWYVEDKQYFLYETGQAKIYGMQNRVFVKLSDNWPDLSDAERKSIFLSTNHETASIADVVALGKFKILNYSSY